MDTKVSMEVSIQSNSHIPTEILKCSVFIPEKKMTSGLHTRLNVLYNFT